MINRMKKENSGLTKFRKAMSRILSNKIYSDYYINLKFNKGIEPESFFEIWIKENTINLDKTLSKMIWTSFLQTLLKERATNKK